MIRKRDKDGVVRHLTPRQLEVLALMAEGYGNQRIASELFITEKAVARHINAIFHSLGISPESEDHRRVRAVLTYLEQP